MLHDNTFLLIPLMLVFMMQCGVRGSLVSETSSDPPTIPSLPVDNFLLPEPRKCSSCQDREISKQIKREIVRNEILHRLGMTSPPNVTSITGKSKQLVRQFLNRYKHELNDYQEDDPLAGFSGTVIDSDEDDHFQTQVINVLATEHPTWLPQKVRNIAVGKGGFIYFNLQTDQLQSNWRDVSKADLRIHLPHAPSVNDHHATIKLFYVSRNHETDHYELLPARTTTVKLRPGHGGWVDMKIWEVVMLWLKNPSENYGFVVKVRTETVDNLDIFSINSNGQPAPVPYLQLDIMETATNNRRKRTLSKVCNEETDASTTNCCLWPLVIDFEKEYGWDFILFPPKYEANFCSGDCSLGVTPEYAHTHLMMQNQKSQAGLSPCCTPKKMSGINLMYIDENSNVILGKIPKMKVDRCGCA